MGYCSNSHSKETYRAIAIFDEITNQYVKLAEQEFYEEERRQRLEEKEQNDDFFASHHILRKLRRL